MCFIGKNDAEAELQCNVCCVSEEKSCAIEQFESLFEILKPREERDAKLGRPSHYFMALCVLYLSKRSEQKNGNKHENASTKCSDFLSFERIFTLKMSELFPSYKTTTVQPEEK